MQVISLSILCNQVATFMTQSPRKQVKHKIVEISATKHPANNPAASVPLLVKQVHKTQTTCLCPTVPSDITISSRALLRELEVHDSATALENLSLSLSVANCKLRSSRKTEEARQNSCAFRFEFRTQRDRDRDRDLILSIKVPGHSLTAQRKASHTKDQKPKCEKIRQWSSSSDIVDIPEQQEQQQHHHHHHQGRQNYCSEIPRRRSRCANESLLRATTTTAFGKRETVASSSLRRKRTGQDPGPKTGGGWVPSDRPASEHGIWSRCRARLGPIR